MQKHVITALRSKAHIVREVAARHGFLYEEASVPGHDDLIRFRIKDMDDAKAQTLVKVMPLEVFAFRGVMTGG